MRATDHYGDALRTHGIDPKSNRKSWNISSLKKAFLQLETESPSALLAQALWTASWTPANWVEKVGVFSRSLATMSIVGAILGLGDRHLDNILIDLRRGEIIHIDFNVCFNKGLRLKVPETVPFRLTQNLVAALGPVGVDGSFRTACEITLSVLRERSYAMLQVLDAFSYDPIVDWLSPGTSIAQYLGQRRNGRFLSILAALKLRMEGRDSSSCQRASVTHEVDRFIEEATKTENKCVMYEGWTAWI